MITELLLPAKSPTMTEGTLVAWKIKPGDQVAIGQVIAEIQTDKAVLEWESSDAGRVAVLLAEAGQQLPVNAVVGLLTTKPGEDTTAAVAEAKAKNAALAAPVAAPAPAAAPAAVPAPALLSAPTAAALSAPLPAPTAKPGKSVRASPVAAKVAAALAVDLRKVTGSGPDGRILRRDVEAAAKDGSASFASAGATAPPKPKLKLSRADGPAQADLPLSPMRSVIGKRLLESTSTIPHFTVSETIAAERLADLREQLAAADVKITVNDLLVRASALALRQHPKLNAAWLGNAIRQFDSADISVAVAIPDGLITPIVARAHTKTVRQIGDEVRALAKKAQEGRLAPAEFQGGSFTISNLGMFGIAAFTAIINPPQVAILAVAGIKDVPVVRAGAVVPGKQLTVTLSADHRAVDGADAAAFLKTLRELLEAPALLLI
ncbi:acetyltransferase component of pyruvate dehydrogenase complex [Planctomycetota bacterium]|nr:acetyltransferase component of pyruvate dehydrogenase complex [Planctomycetota bacterium]